MSVEVHALCKRYGEKQVLQNYSVVLPEKTVLMAPSGAGKTTLLRLLMGLEKPDSGTITGVGHVCAVFQENRLCPQLTAVQNILLAAPAAKAPEALLSALGLTAADLITPAGKLSGGQKRRVALARALLATGDTLLLDEPFTGLDETSRTAAMRAVQDYAGERCVLLVSHSAADAETLGWPVTWMP